MDYFNTKQGVLFYCYTLGVEHRSKIDKFLSLLHESGIEKIIQKEQEKTTMGRPEIDPFALFACILYGFTMGNFSLRDLEASCQYDIRYMYIMDNHAPSHISFGRFINKVIKPHQDEIFEAITIAIMKYFQIDFSDCFIDGTKIEANANKYKFVWKPTKFHEKLSNKARNLLFTMGLQRGIPETGILPSTLLADKVIEANKKLSQIENKNERKVIESMIKNLVLYMEKSLEYEEKEEICGPNRNSYYKTDHDATAMCLKQDYYSGLGSNMHAAYQVQIVISSGIIASYYVSQDRTDIHSFIPAMEKFHKIYGVYPIRICADAGYGCAENYSYCENHNIKAFIKYQSWQGECSGKRPALYELLEDGSIICLDGRKGYSTEVPGRHHKYKGSVFYIIDNCKGCQFMPYCRQYMKDISGDHKIFEINPEYQLQKQKARDLLLSVEGIEMRVNRTCQAEGSFGILKQDMFYDRFRRIGLPQVSVEFMMIALGHNIRKFLRYSEKGLIRKYWSAPSGTEPERFKKPSAKRLTNRITKRRSK